MLNLANNLSKRIYKIKFKFGHGDKKYETYRIKYNYCVCFIEYTNYKDDLIEYKRLCCNKNYKQKFDINLNEGFWNTQKFSKIIISLFYCSEKVFILMNI